MRGDSCYCPLALSLDTYWNCETDCWQCPFRRLNRTWGQDLRPLNVENFQRTVHNSLRNDNPRSPLASALKQRKTIRVGSKADPFQPAEDKYLVTLQAISYLVSNKFTMAIQTHHLDRMFRLLDGLTSNFPELFVMVPYLSPGLDRDWEVLERKRTTPPAERIRLLQKLSQRGIVCGFNGEPFIPGFHTEKDFEDTCRLLKSSGIFRYNTYPLHLNDFVVKRLHAIGLDIEKIWSLSRDFEWRKILSRLYPIAQRYGIGLGCPDFVNSGVGTVEPSNTCCGVPVPNPCRFNTHYWKRLAQQGVSPEEILKRTWDGVGDYEMGRKIVYGTTKEFYTLVDAGIKVKE